MEFEQAIILSRTANEHQQQALDFINEYISDLSHFPSILDLFFQTQKQEIRLTLSFAIDSIISSSISSIDPQILVDFRSKLIPLLFDSTTLPQMSNQIEKIISTIAFNQWPEMWPEFVDEFLSAITTIGNVEAFKKLFSILKLLIINILQSSYITVARSNLLMHELQFKISDIISLMSTVSFEQIRSTGVENSFLEFIISYSELKLEDVSLNCQLIEYLFQTLSTVNSSTFTALKNLILKPQKDASYLHLSVTYIMQLMQHPFQDPTPFICFICHLIRNYIQLIPQCCSDQPSIETFRLILVYTLTSASKTDFCEDIWSMWTVLLDKFADAIHLGTSAIFLLLQPMIPDVLSAFYELLPTSLNKSRLLSYNPIHVFTEYTIIDENLILSFLSQKQPSTSLCIALGIIQFLHPNEILDSLFDQLFPLLLSPTFDGDLNASLFVISRSTKYLSDHLDVLSAALDMLMTLLAETEYSIKHSVLLAMNHLASSIPEQIAQNRLDFISLCVENLVDPTKFQEEDFLRICRIMSKFVALVPDKENRKHLAELLTNPVSALLVATSEKEVLLGCQATTALASISSFNVEIVMQMLWQPISVALNNTKGTEIFSQVCDSFSTTIRTSSFEKCMNVVLGFMSFAGTVENQDCAIVHSLSEIRLCHLNMDTYRHTILETYVERMYKEQGITLEFFEFFEAYDILEAEQPLVVPAACEAIRCNQSNISKKAASLLLKHFKIYQVPFKLDCEGPIIQSLFDAMFDKLHYNCLKKFLKLLYQVVDKMNKRQLPFEQMIFESIKDKVCDDAFSEKYVVALKNSLSKENMFDDLIQQLLIAAGRANPTEFQLLSDVVDSRTKFKSSMPTNVYRNEDEIG